MQLFRVLPSLLLTASKDGGGAALVDSLFSCLSAAGEKTFSLYLVWTSHLHLHCCLATMCHYKEPKFAIWWLHHRSWRALPGPQSLLSSGWANPPSSGIQLPTMSLASADLAQLPDVQLYSLTWPISTLTTCPCGVFVHLSSGFSLLKDCSDPSGFLSVYVCRVGLESKLLVKANQLKLS